MTAGPQVRRLADGDLGAWCREEGGKIRRQACMNQLKALFRSGASQPGMLWWLREEGRVLGRLLLVHDPAGGIAVGSLDLPWRGAWRGSLRAILQPVLADLDGAGAPWLDLCEEALPEGAAPVDLFPVLEPLGFAPLLPRLVLVLRRTYTAGAVSRGLPPGAELDGDGGAVWRLDGPPDETQLPDGLGALAARGALRVRLEWVAPAPTLARITSPPGWVAEESRALTTWRRERAGG